MVLFLSQKPGNGNKASRGWKGGYLKQKKYVLFTVSILLSLILSIQVYAVGDGNLDGGGGSMGQGTIQNSWSPGNEGVRVTVIRAESHDPVTRPIDLTNKHPNITYSFGKVSKMSYTKGRCPDDRHQLRMAVCESGTDPTKDHQLEKLRGKLILSR